MHLFYDLFPFPAIYYYMCPERGQMQSRLAKCQQHLVSPQSPIIIITCFLKAVNMQSRLAKCQQHLVSPQSPIIIQCIMFKHVIV